MPLPSFHSWENLTCDDIVSILFSLSLFLKYSLGILVKKFNWRKNVIIEVT